jgi:hypothetical protein
MKLEIDMEVADDITRCSLLDTYISLKDDLKNKSNLHEDDKERYKKTVKAIEVVGDWYFFNFESSVKEEREKRKKK